jgi:CRP/FNR family cyclic AMP-dependent transcriptional regulator
LSRLAFGHFFAVRVRLLFVLFIAQCVSKFMGNGQVQQVVHAEKPLLD